MSRFLCCWCCYPRARRQFRQRICTRSLSLANFIIRILKREREKENGRIFCPNWGYAAVHVCIQPFLFPSCKIWKRKITFIIFGFFRNSIYKISLKDFFLQNNSLKRETRRGMNIHFFLRLPKKFARAKEKKKGLLPVWRVRTPVRKSEEKIRERKWKVEIYV